VATASSLTCQELVELVTDYFEGALGPADRARFDAHIAECDGCSAYLDQMRATLEGLGRLAPEDLEPEAEELFLGAFRTWKEHLKGT
jgi:anti-sigma factor RsiW